MNEWLAGNLANIVIVFLLLAAVFLALRHIVRSRRSGKCSCGCSDCGGCGGCSSGKAK